jgi:hypothetical protein
MIKLVFLCRRRADVTHAEYARMLLDEHVPLALAYHATMRRYVVNIVEEALVDSPPLDSIGELWFDTLTDFHERLYASEEGERLIARDVPRFMGGADAFATREHVVRAEPPRRLGERTPDAKLCLCLRAPEAAREASLRAWITQHAEPLLARGVVRGCVGNLIEQRLGPDGPDYGAIVELWLARGTTRIPDELCVPSVAACYRVVEYAQRW